MPWFTVVKYFTIIFMKEILQTLTGEAWKPGEAPMYPWVWMAHPDSS